VAHVALRPARVGVSLPKPLHKAEAIRSRHAVFVKVRRLSLTNYDEFRRLAGMSTKTKARPTDAELSLLSVLWDRGPSTVREIHEALGATKGTGYTTTLKILQKMTTKGLVRRDESSRSHIYSPAIRAEQTQRQLLGDLLHRAFAGSRSKLVVQALADDRATADELADIRCLLDELEARHKGGHKR
jgi:BlaI family transcriptional regulator, penicillinase repressor